MFINSSNILFISLTIMGVMVSFSSMSWMMMWIGMEINLMSFLPLISMKSILNSEFSIKYFIIQSLGSMLIMMSLMMIMMKLNNFNSIMNCSLIMKLGSVPFHNWVVSTIDGLSYESILILSTIMKLSPLIMLSYTKENLMVFVYLSMLIGSINGLNQSSMKKLLTFSSIFNLSMMIYSLPMNLLWIQMMMIYSLMMTSIMIIMTKFKINYMNQMIMIEKNNLKKLMLTFCMISLGGLPPLMGFQIKVMMMDLMLKNNEYIMIINLILTSMLTMYYYMNTTISMLMFNLMSMKLNLMSKMKIKLKFMMLLINLNLFYPMMMTKF
uniref:NADH dehydrogenase subunit 2 n=1 Tax=Krisna quadrimaculosus TaxID=3041591 RepID=UPI002551E032|nr:NADH dehydrogenase subunit 2 [Krisna quadrimaculosus]WGG89446.1 NADH dehydrogenase subunit 2 [Krisna quadrimaculosus]